jgi:hypothetical protein
VSNLEQLHPEKLPSLSLLGFQTGRLGEIGVTRDAKMEICSLEVWGAAQVFVVSLAWTRPKRNDRQANHASCSRWAISQRVQMEQSTKDEIKGSVLPWADSLDRASASRFTHPDGAIAAQTAIGVGRRRRIVQPRAPLSHKSLLFAQPSRERSMYSFSPRAKMTFAYPVDSAKYHMLHQAWIDASRGLRFAETTG